MAACSRSGSWQRERDTQLVLDCAAQASVGCRASICEHQCRSRLGCKIGGELRCAGFPMESIELDRPGQPATRSLGPGFEKGPSASIGSPGCAIVAQRLPVHCPDSCGQRVGGRPEPGCELAPAHYVLMSWLRDCLLKGRVFRAPAATAESDARTGNLLFPSPVTMKIDFSYISIEREIYT